jgi:CHAT domain-containing protein
MLLQRLQELNVDATEEFRVLQAMRARRLMEILTADAGDSRPYEPIGVSELQDRLARQRRLTTFADVTETRHGLRCYLVDRTGLRTFDVAGDVASLRAVQWGDVRQRAMEVVALVARSPILKELAAAVTDQLERNSTVLLALDDELANLPLHAIPTIDNKPWCDVVSIGRIAAAGILRFTPPNRSWSGRSVVAGDSKGDLPGAHRECVAVAKALGVNPLVREACTIDAVRGALKAVPDKRPGVPDKRFDVVHLAVHGRADAQHGGRSSLLFAGEHRTWVPFAELAPLKWNANLIVFSGCSTAVGGPRNGIGLYGVAQAAAEAGATTVIASLWPVDDTSAETFMKAFYTELSRLRGTGPIDLRQLMDHARTQLRQAAPLDGLSKPRDGRDLPVEDPDVSAPIADAQQAAMMHWAPFLLIGEPTLIV